MCAPELVWTFWSGESLVPAKNQAQDCPICNLFTVLPELSQHPKNCTKHAVYG